MTGNYELFAEHDNIKFGDGHLQLAENFWERVTDLRHQQALLKAEEASLSEGEDVKAGANAELDRVNLKLDWMYTELAKARENLETEGMLAHLHYEAASAKAAHRSATAAQEKTRAHKIQGQMPTAAELLDGEPK